MRQTDPVTKMVLRTFIPPKVNPSLTAKDIIDDEPALIKAVSSVAWREEISGIYDFSPPV